MEATFSSWFLGPYKVRKIEYGLLLYALQSAKRTNASFIGAILKEHLLQFSLRNIVFTIFSNIIYNPVVLVLYYHFPFYSYIEKQVIYEYDPLIVNTQSLKALPSDKSVSV